MIRAMRVRDVLLLIAVGLVGCGEVVTPAIDAPPPPDATPPPPCERADVPLQDFLGCLGQAYCERLRTCGLFDVGTDVDCADGPISLDDDLNLRQARTALPGLIEQGRVAYDGTAAATCLADIPQLACRDLLELDDVFTGCPILTGTAATLAACEYDVECAVPGSVCAPVGMTSAGSPPDCMTMQTCRAPVATGGICEGNLACRPGDHCIRDNLGNDICRPGDQGSSCGSDGECDTGLYCPGGVSGMPGVTTCQPALAAGAPCGDFSDCQPGLDCVTATGTCEVAATVGAPCGSLCGAGLVCNQVTGTCVEFSMEGAPCASDTECLSGLAFFNQMECDDAGTPADPVDDTCQSPGEVGEVCASTSDCDVGLHCTAQLNALPEGLCGAPRANGLACNNDNQCASGHCAGIECADIPVCTL